MVALYGPFCQGDDFTYGHYPVPSQAICVVVVVEAVKILGGSHMEPDWGGLQQVWVEGNCIQREVVGFRHFQDPPEVRGDLGWACVPRLQEATYSGFLRDSGGSLGKMVEYRICKGCPGRLFVCGG